MFLLLSLGRYLSAAGLSVVYGYGQNNICGGATGRGPVQKYSVHVQPEVAQYPA